MHKKGFTLAEVLIVLGVIGVVAALTIPALMKNWQEDRWKTEQKVFESRLSEAVGQMHAKGRLIGRHDTDGFIAELQNYMKITQACPHPRSQQYGDGCDETGIGTDEMDAINKYYNSMSFKQNWSSATGGVKLVNGVRMLIAYNPNCNLDPAADREEAAKCVAAIYDLNGRQGPNVMGKDIAIFNEGNTPDGATPAPCVPDGDYNTPLPHRHVYDSYYKFCMEMPPIGE